MEEYTNYKDWKEYILTLPYPTIGMIRSVSNLGVLTGDLKIQTMINRLEAINDEYEILRYTHAATEKYISIRMAHANEYDWLDETHLYSCFGLYLNGYNQGPIVTGYFTANDLIETNVRIKMYAVDENEETLISDDTYFTYRSLGGLIPQVTKQTFISYLGIEPEDSSIDLFFYSNRAYATSYEDVSLSGSEIEALVSSYNMTSYLRDNNKLSLLIEGADADIKKYPYRKYYFYNKTFTVSGDRIRSMKGEYTGSGRLSGYIDGDVPYNIKLISSGELEERINDEEEYHEITNLPRLTSNDTIGSFYGLLDTNIPIFNNIIKAGEYLLTGNTEDAINEIDTDEDSKTGKDGTIARFDRANSYIIPPSRAQRVYDATDVITDVMQWMMDISNQNIFHALDFYWFGNNPIEGVVGFYWSPFDMHELCRRSEPETIIMAGIPAGYKGAEQVDYYEAPVCQYQGKEKLLGQYQFSRKYNDWRDYNCFSYRLYLPFYGIVDLEPYFIVGKRLEVKYIYYPTNHMIHYMLFVKQNLYKEFDCSVGIDLSMISSDAVGKASQMFSNSNSLINSGINAATSGPSGIVGSVTNSVTSVIDMFKQPSMLSWGCVNPTSNIGDPLQALLFIEEQKCIIPEKLHELYGYATYYIGQISTLSGYCEFSDVRLKTSATPDEKNQIISMMNSGIII